jgi:hypothetical protein
MKRKFEKSILFSGTFVALNLETFIHMNVYNPIPVSHLITKLILAAGKKFIAYGL